MKTMNRMRTVVLAVCTLAVSALPMTAQEPAAPPPPPAEHQGAGGHGGPGGHRDPAQMEARQIEMLTDRLRLTPDQVAQVKGIEEGQRTQMMALREDKSLQQDDKRTRMMTMRQESEGKIRGVLTDEQKTKFDATLARRREHRGPRPDDAGGPPPPAPQR